MPVVFFPEWTPDQADTGSAGSPVIKNCVPLTASSYGPMATPAVYSSNALSERCQGSYSIKDDSGTVYIIAGDRTKLYQNTLGSTAFADVSRLVGGPYATLAVPHGFWSMTSYGDQVIATNGVDAIQAMTVGAANFVDLSAAAPKAKFAATVKDFLMVAHTTDSVDGVTPYRVWWSAINDPSNWPTPGSVPALQLQSDYQDLQQTDLGPIAGLIGGGLGVGDATIFCERGIWQANYAGPPTFFGFRVAQGAAGTLAPLSIIQGRMRGQSGVLPMVFYLGEDGFRAFDGHTSIPIGAQKFDNSFFAELDPAYLGYVQAAADPTAKLIFWAFMATGSGGLFTRLLAYNWELNRAALIDMQPVKPGEWLTRAIYSADAKTLEDLDAFGTLDELPASLDDPIWSGNAARTLSMFDGTHRLNTMSGLPMLPVLETGETQPSPGRRSFVINSRPLVDGGPPLIAVGHRDRIIDPVVWEASVPMNVIGECPQRCTGRYVRYRLSLQYGPPPGLSPLVAFRHIQGIEPEARPEGKLR